MTVPAQFTVSYTPTIPIYVEFDFARSFSKKKKEKTAFETCGLKHVTDILLGETDTVTCHRHLCGYESFHQV